MTDADDLSGAVGEAADYELQAAYTEHSSISQVQPIQAMQSEPSAASQPQNQNQNYLGEPSTTDVSSVSCARSQSSAEYIQQHLEKQIRVFNASIDYNHYLIQQQFADIAVTNSIYLRALDEMRRTISEQLDNYRKLMESTQNLMSELNRLPQHAVDASLLLQALKSLSTRVHAKIGAE